MGQAPGGPLLKAFLFASLKGLLGIMIFWGSGRQILANILPRFLYEALFMMKRSSSERENCFKTSLVSFERA